VVQQRTPLGVVVTITPWSFPMLLLMMKVAPALLAGNTVVAKPAPTTPLTTLRFGELCADVFPAGVVNVIVDQNDLGDALRGHPDVAKVSFTGSTLTSKKFMASVAGTLKRMTLELGSNDAAIVLDDSDLETVAPKVLAGAMMNSGQVCRAIKRLYVHESQYDEMRDALGQMAREIVVDDARHAQEGPFDPVLPVLRYSDIDDVIARANNTLYGRGGSIWSSDPERAFDVAAKTDSGAVWFDQPMGLPADIASAGANQSGLGQQMDQEGLEEFTQMKVTNMAK
jgi:acyl-CoA reductase-like NAD-dependent aldehyde dehydrogenase